MRPSVTVVVATRDRPELLRRTLRSIAAQDHEGALDTVVVYDQSEPDATLADGTFGPVTVIRNDRTPGLAGARNTGVAAATGDWVAFCDDDDEWFPDKLRSQLDLAAGDPGLGVVTSGIEIVHGERRVVRLPERERLVLDDLLRSRVMEAHPSSVIVRRDLFFDVIGPVDEAIPGSYAEDYEWILRAVKVTGVGVVRRPLVRVWWGPASFFAGRWRMIAEALDYLLDRYPEFDRHPAGKARVVGQIAFAEAAAGRRLPALHRARHCIGLNWREPRGWLAGAVAAGVPPAVVTRALNSRGRGI